MAKRKHISGPSLGADIPVVQSGDFFTDGPWLMALALVLMTFVAYAPVWHAGFVWDDEQSVTSNALLRTAAGLQRTWVEPSASFQYYPLTYTVFWIQYHLWGLHPLGYHLVNVLLHALNAVLLWFVLRKLKIPGAWAAAAIFAVHPVHVESVAWVSELKNVLSGFFFLGSLLAYLHFVSSANRRWRLYVLAFILFLCALLAKTSAVSMPLAAVLVLWWKRERIRRQDVLALLPFCVAGAALGLLTAWVEVHSSGAHGPEWQLSILQRSLIAGRAVWFYAGKLIWPYPLTIVYPRWQINTAFWWQYLFPLAAVAVALTLWFSRKRLGRAPLVAVLFFAGMIVPTPAFINIAFMRYSYVADHWQYLPSLSLIALAVACAASLIKQRTVRAWVALVTLTGLGALSWQHCQVFRDQETLFSNNLSHNRSSWVAHYNLGNALVKAGRLQDAIGHYEQVLRIKPHDVETHNNLGTSMLRLGNVQEAIAHYEQALRIKPDYAEAHYNLGLALTQLGKVPEAIGHYEQALRIKPDYAEAHYNLGAARQQAGQVPEAITHYEQALRIEPDNAEAHNNLGVALVQVGRVQEAIWHFDQALHIKPDYTNARNNLARARAIQ